MNRSWLLFKRVKMYTRLYKYALYWDWLMCNSCKFFKIPDILRHFIRGFRNKKWLPQNKFTGATLALVACNFSYTLICPWRKAIREIWKIPNISHCRLLPYLPISRVVIGREVDYIDLDLCPGLFKKHNIMFMTIL